ncbi:hypothetical protein GCM10023350_50230 [Nocardioides endophyticus]|uniref:PucR C-terminal helix-turn-helix domain-containing protein n=1 Tax=Nocardioides endophyticus TaxID=1353775 RepID=A0ABP8ZJH9_9ACTN
MTGHDDRPDIRQRRRVDRLRAELGLAPVPTHVGTELRTIAPLVSEQVTRLLRLDPTYTALSPDGQTQLLAALTRVVDEFALLVENRPPQAPTVDTMLATLIQLEDETQACRAALNTALQTIREVARVLWPQLPHAQSYSTQLDTAVTGYAQRLHSRTMNAQRAQCTKPTSPPQAVDTTVEGLLDLVHRRWGTRPVQLYLTVSTLAAADTSSRREAPRGTGPHLTTRPLRHVITDHVVTVTENPVPPPRSATTTDAPVVVSVGPVPASQIELVHDTALLLLRVIRAGVATPPSPVRIHVPNLGFLHPYPSEASVRKIRDLLLPLTRQGGHRRSTLGRTLQLRLRTAATAQGLARQLAMHPQTVHNHLTILRTLYNHDLDFAGDNLSMQAALDLVLPLWEMETTGRDPDDPRRQKLSSG